MARGKLRIYFGAAPGVGKTYAMLDEAHRRVGRGTDLVVAFVETHGRPRTAALLDGLEVVPRRAVSYRGATLSELDVDAVLARAPAVALVDEFAHSNPPGPDRPKRWQDVAVLLDAGIDVITTVNVQHLESLNDVVEKITGVRQRETVPDAVVRAAEQIEVIDLAPEALRRRMAHGNIYAPDRVDAALSNYFRPGNLTALRELALLWVAGTVEEQLDRYRAAHDITGTWETRERVVVAVTGGPEGETLIRRAARIAARTSGADLLALHVARSDGLSGADPSRLEAQRTLVEELGGTYHQAVGEDVPAALLDFARAENATQLVLGASRRGRLAQALTPGIGASTVRSSGSIDVHLVTHAQAAGRRRLPRVARGLAVRRRVGGAVLAVALPVALTATLSGVRGTINVADDLLVFLLAVVVVALVGGIGPAVVAAVLGSMLLNVYFVPPLHRFTVAGRENVIALVAFVAVAVMVSSVVDLAARRTGQAARASAEAELLSTVAGSVLRGGEALPALLERVREAFGFTAVALLERGDEATGWAPVAAVGERAPERPDDADATVPVRADLTLALRGRLPRAEDRRVLDAFAAQAAVALNQRRLAEEAARAAPLAEADRARTALLTAVSHDLRGPLASARASISSLCGGEVDWTPEESAELLATADESLDVLTRLVENLLDMTRLRAGALSVLARPVGVDDVVAAALAAIGTHEVTVAFAADLPEVHADPGLLERIVGNLVANALRFAPPGQPPLVSVSHLADRVELRVIDRGPGVREEDWDQIFVPFQRLYDRDNTTGVGLGLALSRGLAEAMGGTLTPEHTPGGGLTMVLSLPVDKPLREPAAGLSPDRAGTL